MRQPIASGLLAAALVAAACSGAQPATDPIVIGSFDSLESEVIGEIYRQALVAEGFPVVHRARIGDRSEVNTLMRNGEIDLVPEYLGSALEVTFAIEPSTDLAATFRALADAWFAEEFLVMLPAPAQRQNGFAMTRGRADELGVTALSDLAEHAPTLTFGGPPECPRRPRCLPGLAEMYGISFGNVETLDAGGPATLQALAEGRIDVGLVFTSDPAVEDGDLVLIDDDLGLQPVESIVAVVSASAAERFGDDLLAVVDDVSAVLEQRALVQLNRLVAGGRVPAAAAEEWLLVNGFGE